MKNKKVALGLSGGVDSALSAYLLIEQGYEVVGVYIECWNEPGCRAEQDHKDALEIALKLGIPFRVLDYKKKYKNKVMQYFLDEYKAGKTPNPDVMCNKVIKFGMFYNWAIKEESFDCVATGHYAQIIEKNGQKFLASGKDNHKDQTYFLHQLKEKQLDHILFPVGHLLKKEVREQAKKRKISVAQKKDSVGICFVGDINVRKFIKEKLGENPGDVVDEKGATIGSHLGLWFYTVGQRHGFQIETKKLIKKINLVKNKQNPPPLYVIGKNVEKNQLIVGTKIKTARNSFKIKEIHWINGELKSFVVDSMEKNKKAKGVLARIRHTGKLVECQLEKSEKGWLIKTKDKLNGIASGQYAVFYTKNKKDLICLGGGVIL